MEEKLADRVQKTADFLHWLGKYDECNALIMTARLMRAHGIETLEEWTKFVENEELAHHSEDRCDRGAPC